MAKIAFKNPKGGTIYLAKVGFDWGAFWGIFIGGLPFFLRKMNMLGAFCLVLFLCTILSGGFDTVREAIEPIDSEEWWDYLNFEVELFLILGISLYFGMKGGKLTARHYIEEGYKVLTKDKTLLAHARNKWNLEI